MPESAVKYELLVNGKHVYTWHKLKTNTEVEKEMIANVKRRFKNNIENGTYHSIYKTEKIRLE